MMDKRTHEMFVLKVSRRVCVRLRVCACVCADSLKGFDSGVDGMVMVDKLVHWRVQRRHTPLD